MTSLSVAMIVQNEQDMLPATLECLWPLSHLLCEVVIVDGGSEDDTRKIARSSLLPVRYLERPFDNFRAQKNYALDACTGDWILLLDADMLVNSYWLKAALEKGYFDPALVWDFNLYFARGDRRHFCVKSTQAMGSTRLCRNAGLRYERDVHEYLVLPGESGWASIHNAREDVLRSTSQGFIIECHMLKTAKALRDRAKRYKAFAEQSKDAGISLDGIGQYAEDLIAHRWDNAVSIPAEVLKGFPSSALDMPIPYMESVWQYE